MRPSTRRIRLLGLAFSAVALALLAVVAWGWNRLSASLPALDGEQAVAGLSAPAAVARDAQGVVTITAANRLDVARALGFAHGQDRFFQMDLIRRRAAGELAEIIGAVALDADRGARLHGFRRLARIVIERSPAAHRALLEAYAAGVNAGLSSLAAPPFEYLVLRSEPAPWLPEDTFLVLYAMTLDLQDETGSYEQSVAAVRDTLGEAAVDFFAPRERDGDAALDGSTAPPPPVPGPRAIDLRSGTARRTADAALAGGEDPVALGSNSFGLAGGRTTSGAALVANDMHLGHGVPNIWYRASLTWAGRTVTGVTLPGTPLIVAGSNGQIAWGFTNSYADLSDLVAVDVNDVAPDGYYMRGTELVEYETRRETLRVRGGEPVAMESRWTEWGPIVGRNAKGKPLALKWVMHDPAAVNLNLVDLEQAGSVDEAIAIAHRSGIPTQNLLVGDRSGQLAWTLAGHVPERFGFDGRAPVGWGFGDRGWKGLLPAERVPVVRAEADGHLWTANNRLVGGEALALLGDGGYAAPVRARQIRDGLAAVGLDPAHRATPADLLAVQLDDRAVWLEGWQQQLLATLTDEAVAGHPAREELRERVRTWEGRASVDSVSYRLVRAWRDFVADRALPPLFAPCLAAYPDFSYRSLPYEQALWTMVTTEPIHLLRPEFTRWSELLLAAADDVMADLDRQKIPSARATWGARNTSSIRHPLSRALPAFIGRHLDMPAQPLPGDSNLPRVQRPSSGASERFVVSPGREAEGIFHMPAGQSGHPLSPFYRAGHDAWVKGEPTPFLPGATVHTLTLKP